MLILYKYASSALLASFLVGCGGDKGSNDKGSNDSDSKGSNDTIHNQGKSCISCHDFNGATVFSQLNASDDTIGVAGYKVQLGGTDIYNSSNGIGNSNYRGTASNPTYTAHVIDANGNISRSSATNSHDSTRLDCNRCHTATGENGAPGRLTP